MANGSKWDASLQDVLQCRFQLFFLFRTQGIVLLGHSRQVKTLQNDDQNFIYGYWNYPAVGGSITAETITAQLIWRFTSDSGMLRDFESYYQSCSLNTTGWT